jgi:hypothetical protein
MDQRILVTYASKYGATKGIALKTGEVLRQMDSSCSRRALFARRVTLLNERRWLAQHLRYC